ncbi:creatininase family protein [Bacillus sp. ISL-47]|uniref:creatininase family protein n=1 Tax=Bacillus sp. ISL-47 TaxID=2819130 RepID=UPI001BE8E604|nr:creatininase family protein [Bacillus sp. ISL-47]MBT2690368.1 creatininase family protein [Bacillus sp. ISL-47]MBT2709182.1 creatininase family protein [Pseudomonas sp. ISL-84]
MNCYDLTKMTWKEVEESLQTVEIAIIPVGAHEQHGPHMAESCDAVLAEKMAIKLGERMFPYAIVTPVVNMGVSEHHMHFPGTISLQPATLIAVLKDMVSSLKQHGIKKFLFLNSHGGNQSTLNLAAMTITKELDVEVYYAKTTASAKESIGKFVKSPLFGHSCEREVSEALYLAPELVRTELLEKGDIREDGRWKRLRPGKAVQGFYFYEEMTQNGCIGDGRQGSREIGKQIVDEALKNLTEELSELLDLKAELLY